MEYLRLGNSGLRVSRLCQGTAMFGTYVAPEKCKLIVDACVENGINFIDTANSYGDGKSEESLGVAIKGRRQEFVIATKVRSPIGQGINDAGASRRHILSALDASLRRLGTDYIDLYQIHDWDAETPLEETMRTLNQLVRDGKVRYIGCSNFAAWQLCKALWISDKLGLERFESIQVLYNFRARDIEPELMNLCLDQQISINLWQVLMAGILTGSYNRLNSPPKGSPMSSEDALIDGGVKSRYWNQNNFDLVENISTIANDLGCTPTQLTLAWALSKPRVTSVLVGATEPEQVYKNAKGVDLSLSEDTLAILDKS